MDTNTNIIASVENDKNKTDVETIRLQEAHQKYPNYNAVCMSSKIASFVNSCRENYENICDEKHMELFHRFTKQGW